MLDAAMGSSATLFEPRDHYWIIAGETARLWSSVSAAYVAANDERLAAWQRDGRRPTAIANEFELDQVLRQHGLALARAFSAEEALGALMAIDGARVRAALGRDRIGGVLPGDADKLLSLAIELQPTSSDAAQRKPEIDGVEMPKTAEEDLADLKQRFATREAELVEKGTIAAS
jgi:hypothetical protein